MLTGKSILVTGASRGIGRAVAAMAAEEGARVLLHFGSNREAAETVLDLLPGEGHEIFEADLSSADAPMRLAEAVLSGPGCPDALVNNAGIFRRHPPAKIQFDQWLRDWNATLAVNLSAAAHLSFFFGRAMARRGGGRIVNLSSRGAFRGEPDAPAYGASKAGMNAMGQSMAVALAPEGVLVFTVAPGFVETDMAGEHLAGPDGDSIRAQSPLGRVASPEEIARTVLFLAFEAPESMTGAIVDVNGASYLRS